MVALEVFPMPHVDRVVFQPSAAGDVAGRPVSWKREHRPRCHGVVVAILLPPVTDEDEIADEAAGRWGSLGKGQAELVARIHDDVAIIHCLEQLADVAEPRVKALQIAPAGRDT